MNPPKFNNPGVDLNITFIYFRDMPRAIDFYQNTLGFEVAIDQGWCKIFQVSGTGHIGLVDETRGFFRASDTKPVMLCLRVPDVDAWYTFIQEKGVKVLKEIKNSEALHIRAFLFQDPEGHVIEIQSPIP